MQCLQLTLLCKHGQPSPAILHSVYSCETVWFTSWWRHLWCHKWRHLLWNCTYHVIALNIFKTKGNILVQKVNKCPYLLFAPTYYMDYEAVYLVQ